MLRRGVPMTAAVSAIAIQSGQTRASVPAGLAARAIAVALACKEGALGPSVVSKSVADLVHKIGHGVWLSSSKNAVLLALGVSALACLAGWAASQPSQLPSDDPPQATSVAEARPDPLKQARIDRQGDPLPAGALARLGSVRFRHCYELKSIVFGPLDRTLFAAGSDGMIRVWDASTGNESPGFAGHKGAINRLAISRDKTMLASAGDDGTVRIWDVAARKEVKRMEANDGPVTFVALGEGGILASASGLSVKLWDIKAGLEKGRMALPGDAEHVNSLAFTPDSKIVLCSHQGVVRLWEVPSGTLKHVFERHWTFALTEDGKKLLMPKAGEEGLDAWDVDTLKKLFYLEEEKLAKDRDTGRPNGWHFSSPVDVSPDGKTLAAVTEESSDRMWSGSVVRIWDLEARKLRATLGHTNYGIHALAFSRDGTKLAVGPAHGTIRVWDVATGQTTVDDGHQEPVNHLTYMPDGKGIISGSHDATCRIWDAATGIEQRRFDLIDVVSGIALSPDKRTLVVGGGAGHGNTPLPALFVWDLTTGAERGRFRLKTDRGGGPLAYSGAVAVAFAPDGRTFVVGTHTDERIHFWDAAGLKELRNFQAPKHVERLAYSPDGKILAGAGKQVIYLWESATGRELTRLPGHTTWWPSFAFSPDGSLVATADGQAVRLWETATGLERWRMPMASPNPTFIAFSPNGRWLATGGKPARDAHVLEATTGKEVLTLSGHKRPINAAAFSPDSRQLATGSEDTTVLVWDLQGRLQ
jgi:WD40 repeat protein